MREIRYRYKGKDLKYNNIDSILESYYNNSISKLEFLMRINLLGNRSFKDINQYPIFPWIINNYNNNFNDFTTIKELLNNNLRPLDKPMGVIGKSRFESYKSIYNITKEEFIEEHGELIKIDLSKESI